MRNSETNEKKILAAQMYMGGMTLRQVGAELGVSHERIRQYLHELGVRRRPRGPITNSNKKEKQDGFKGRIKHPGSTL